MGLSQFQRMFYPQTRILLTTAKQHPSIETLASIFRLQPLLLQTWQVCSHPQNSVLSRNLVALKGSLIDFCLYSIDKRTCTSACRVYMVLLLTTPAFADPLSVPVWQNTYGEARKQLPDPAACFPPLMSSHHASDSFSSPQTLAATGSILHPQLNQHQQDTSFEPAATPSTLRSPSENGLLLSNRAFSPTGAIINSALATSHWYAVDTICISWPHSPRHVYRNLWPTEWTQHFKLICIVLFSSCMRVACSSPGQWVPQPDSDPYAGPCHTRKPSGFGVDPLQAMHSSQSALVDPLSTSAIHTHATQEPSPQAAGSLFAPNMSAPPPRALFTPNMVPVSVQQGSRATRTSTDNETDSAEVFTPCMSTPGTTRSSQAESDGISTFIPSMPSTGGRTLSGLFGACVADTLGFGSGNTVRH